MSLQIYLAGVSTGAALSLLFWLWFLLKYFPRKMEQMKEEFKAELPKTVTEIAPILKKELKLDAKGILKQIADALKDPDDKEMRELMAYGAFHVTHAAMDMFENDDHVKAFFRGFINKEAETFFKSLTTRGETLAAQYGVDLNLSGNEAEVDPSMAKIVKLLSVFKQAKGIFGGA